MNDNMYGKKTAYRTIAPLKKLLTGLSKSLSTIKKITNSVSIQKYIKPLSLMEILLLVIKRIGAPSKSKDFYGF
ncbi:MAG TPA: hypothetical protein DF296_15145 [Candidatus Margulisbacteria bacterium]|nr:MAG: hypothetical protein A2X41_09795 [Candidatus Margulisbacteria bacterium GWE2_39_32]HAR62375.1 hypothetical protein [Candidatus Margulisiibacteriota bacterium]HCT86527.1 hypothetical protein [Candidatus Margulisiibacteriota bacterium]